MYGDTAILQNFNNVEMYKLIFLKFEIFGRDVAIGLALKFRVLKQTRQNLTTGCGQRSNEEAEGDDDLHVCRL